MYNVIIIGGMAAGCKAAARLSRLCPNYLITLIETSSFISFSTCGLPFYAAGEINDLSDLNKTPYSNVRDKKFFSDVYGVHALTNTEVIEIEPGGKKVKCKNIDKDEEFELRYDYLILATGSEAIKPNFAFPSTPLISSFHSPIDTKYFRHAAQKGEIEKAVIIGGGFIGCEMVEALNLLWGIETILIEKENSLLNAILDPEISGFIESCISSDKIQLLLSTSINKIELDEKGLPVVFLEKVQKIEADYVFYCLGVKPNTKLAEKSNIKIGRYGGILVDEQMKTNIPDIWAAGDCVEMKNLVTNKQDYFSFGSLSNRMGRVAADSIAGIPSLGNHVPFKGAVGTASLKLFDNVICAAGLTEKKAQKLFYKTGSVIGCWHDRPDYHPEAKNILGKLVYEKSGFKLLGLQLIGEGEVTRYIDVFSELLSQTKNVEDLLNIEHAYMPAHSSPISPLNYLGALAINQEKDGVRNFNPLLLDSFKGIYIDVREPFEVEASVSVHLESKFSGRLIQIPLSDLRFKLNDFDLDQPIMFVCEKGTRAYEASRIFMNYGYKNVSYLGGGILLYDKINKFSNYFKNNIINLDNKVN